MSDTAIDPVRPRTAPVKSWPVRLTSPVRNRRGGFSPLKSATLLLICLPAARLAWEYAHDMLGARPVLALVHGTGLWAFRLVLITLALTPARWLLDWPGSSVLRRMLGVSAACYASLHLALYCAQQNFHLLHVSSEIVHRFYLTIGFFTLIMLTALAATSTDATMRAMGRNWKRLHRLIYPAAALALLHFFLQSKADVFQAVVMAGLLAWLIAWRLLPAGWRDSLWAALGLGVLATLATAGIEVAWYGLTTGISVRRVFLANFRVTSFRHWRPSLYVAVSSLAALAFIAARRLAKLFPQTR